jgi:hypothetical protein
MLDILIIKLNGWKKELKDLLEFVRQQNECTSMLQIQGHEYIILDLIWPFEYIIHIYNIWVHEADVIISPLLQHSSTFILHDTKQKRG